MELTVRVLRQPPQPRADPSRPAKFLYMLRLYASHEVPGVRVRLRFGDLTAESVSDDEGFARFELRLPSSRPLPEHADWESCTLDMPDVKGAEPVEAAILAPGCDNRIAVISDIDDTIIETGITGGIHNVVRNWKRIFAQMPQDRILVKGADAFYGAIGGGLAVPSEQQPTGSFIPATHRPFFYISSSPWNLFSYLVAFKRSRELPLGALFLRRWGFNRATIGKRSHGEHKQTSIAAILDHFSDLRFAFIGLFTRMPANGGGI